MDKINSADFQTIMKDVRTSYRLIALYQTRLKDVIKYILDQYTLNFEKGFMKFTDRDARSGKRINLDAYSWDWLPMYLYQFSAKPLEKGNDKFYFHVFHQADTGFYDAFGFERNANRLKVDEFAPVENSKTRLFFVLSKNDDGWPHGKILHDKLNSETTEELVKNTWIAKPYDLELFISQEEAIKVIEDFSNFCFRQFEFHLKNDINDIL